ncbi:MAG TPA: FAD-dependent oxidoreductase, partial [Vicinamibacteria bacterium]
MAWTTDVAIVGGGIVGLATAFQIGRRRPGLRVLVLEKEDRVAEHQTGRNSGVIHSGIYYKPGSRKALSCRRGKEGLEAFCREHGVPFDRCGKVVVATEEAEVPRLRAIEERARANGVACDVIGVERLRELEPHAAGVAALHVPETGIVDYRVICDTLVTLLGRAEGQVV